MLKVAGVYSITVNDGRKYIGGTVDLRSRWNIHRYSLAHGTHENKHLTEVYQREGLSALKFECLILCAPKDLIMYETIAFAAFKPELNVCPGKARAEFTDEHRRKMSESRKRYLMRRKEGAKL